MNFKNIIISFMLIIPLNLFSGNAQTNLKTCEIFMFNKTQEKITITVEIAETRKQMAIGLMYRDFMEKDHGMIFIYNDEKYRNFWMKNTRIPLSIAYIDHSGIIVDIQKMKPLDTSVTYISKYPAKYCLEMNQGWFEKNKIEIGTKLYLDGCISK